MSAVPADLAATTGFVVADSHGRVVGRVEAAMFGPLGEIPDALAVRRGRIKKHLRLVPASTIDRIDIHEGVVALRVARDSIRRFH